MKKSLAEKKDIARHSSIQKMWLSLQVKPEFPPDSPFNFGVSENILNENKNIPLFVFEYFMQKKICGLISKTLERACLFHFTDVHGHGIISALIVMTKLRREVEYLD